jgi:hypothetical protein
MRDMDTHGDISSMVKGISSYKGYIEVTAWLMMRIFGEKGLIMRKRDPTSGSTMQVG